MEWAARLYLGDIFRDLGQEKLTAVAEQLRDVDSSFNIYYLGGSTLAGVIPQISIPQVVEASLDTSSAELPINSFNLAIGGANLESQLENLQIVLADRETYKPSAVVIYSGHNEFLQYHQPYGSASLPEVADWFLLHSQLLQWLSARFGWYRFELAERNYFDVPLFAEAEYDEVAANYERRLQETVDTLGTLGIPVIVSTLAGNYADWAPNRSVYCDDSSMQAEFSAAMDTGQRAMVEARFTDALQAYEAALQICDRFAEAHYQKGVALRASGQAANAARSFELASGFDRMPIRALPRQNAFIRGLSGQEGVSVVDSVAILRGHAEQGLIGFNLMIDGHHPNARGYMIIGHAIANALNQLLFADALELKELSAADVTLDAVLDDEDQYDIHVWNGNWFIRLSTWRFDPSERLARAEAAFVQAHNMFPQRVEPHLGFAIIDMLRGDTVGSRAHLTTAREINSAAVDAYLARPWVGSAMLSTQ